MDIFVTTDFQQLDGDSVIETLPGDIALIRAATVAPYKKWRVQDTDGSLMATFIKLRMDAIVSRVDSMLEDAAHHLRYDNMASVRSYAGYVNAYQAEATELAVWASDCWKTLEGVETGVRAGTSPIPTVDEAVALLPAAPASVASIFKAAPAVKLP